MALQIEFDYQIFSLQRYGGISRYFAEVALRLAGREGVEAAINCPFYINMYLKAMPSGLARGRHVGEYRKTHRLRQWLNARLSPGRAPFGGQGIRHLTYYRSDARPGVANVVTVYDMAHERFPEEFGPRDTTSRDKAAAVRMADAVVCISHHTRKELLDLIPLDPAKVFVTHLGFTPLAVPAGYAPPAPLPSRPYILYVGNRGGYKNFAGLLAALAGSEILRKEFDLLCLGGGPFTESETARIRASGLQGRVRQSPADDALLGHAYAHAAVFAYPSLYEGFGIPPLEAMSAGCPVVCGTNTSLAEVVGDAARTVDPADPGSLAAGLESVLGSPAERARLARAGRERAAGFSWDQCADATLAVYRGLAGRAGPGPAGKSAGAVAAPDAKFAV